jgi:putative endonuclease
MYFIYVIYSPTSDVYYTGYSTNHNRRLEEHNTSTLNTFTSKHRPWILKSVFKCGPDESDAVRLERFIKKQKSRKLLEQLCKPSFIPSGALDQLVRVPHLRDYISLSLI